MDSLIIGSTAARKWFPEFRDPAGLDIALESPDDIRYRAEHMKTVWFPELWSAPREYRKTAYAHPDMLYTIKLTRYDYFPSEKDAADIDFFKQAGCQVIDNLFEILHNKWRYQLQRKLQAEGSTNGTTWK